MENEISGGSDSREIKMNVKVFIITLSILFLAGFFFFLIIHDREPEVVLNPAIQGQAAEKKPLSPAELAREEKNLFSREARYQQIVNEVLAEHEAPKPGDLIEIKQKDGTVIKGILESYYNNNDEKGEMRVRAGEGALIFDKSTISFESRIKYYTEDHVMYYTEKQMKEEFPDYKPPTFFWVADPSFRPMTPGSNKSDMVNE